ncbi:hypothetical protein O6H91_09G013100 [Diphasiastrum complanatum]|uniref:Uncharacterized protein n=1 Tax=Diphasiastrum complanatum TaxID=34168 RepID=A0ACC2CLI1_DIPCM|nr:hypothetical protein O6H91_Y245100 [Diphasiastrum complanatum]KAJ7542811.1 hypothetical protein O6H91_09G013100 [Diphasiastrum complanatum]
MLPFDPIYGRQEEFNTKYRRLEEFEGRRAMPNLMTDLRLNIGHYIEVEESNRPRHCPVQLDLLPLKPVAHHAKEKSVALPLAPPNQQLSWHPFYHETHRTSIVECSEREEKISSASHRESVIGIDINHIPASTESDEPNNTCSPSSTHSLFQFDGIQIAESNYAKRERQRDDTQELDDRTCEINSRGASDEEEGCNPRKKLRLSKEQSALLEESFKEHSTLTPKQKQALAKQLSLRPRQVEVWFQNRRARTKLKQTEVDCELLKRCCESLTEENRRLQRELQELRAMKVTAPCVIAQDFYMPLPATTLSMCPSCERLSTVENRSLGISKSRFTKYTQSSAA